MDTITPPAHTARRHEGARATTEVQPFAELLPWDSEFFGFRIGRVRMQGLEAIWQRRIEAWADAHRVHCVYLEVDALDPGNVRLAEDSGFRLIDVRVCLSVERTRYLSLMPEAQMRQVRLWQPEDLEALQAIARVSHHHSRFYRDERFPRSRCDDMYAHWIEGACHGDADEVLVAGPVGAPLGYTVLHRHHGMGLLAVREDARGLGWASVLVQASLDWCAAEGLDLIRAVAQSMNIGSQRMLQKFGFRNETTSLLYHRWFPR